MKGPDTHCDVTSNDCGVQNSFHEELVVHSYMHFANFLHRKQPSACKNGHEKDNEKSSSGPYENIVSPTILKHVQGQSQSQNKAYDISYLFCINQLSEDESDYDITSEGSYGSTHVALDNFEICFYHATDDDNSTVINSYSSDIQNHTWTSSHDYSKRFEGNADTTMVMRGFNAVPARSVSTVVAKQSAKKTNNEVARV